MGSHEKTISHSCENCESHFPNQSELERHTEQFHKENISSFEDWNCNDCIFQGHDAETLLKHLKLKNHQPSPLVEKRSLFPDYKECYTCKEQFDGYINLMEHRKMVHPSDKKCRNFLTMQTGLRKMRDSNLWMI